MTHLKNTYYTLRHGQSKANTLQIVLSDLHEGQKSEYALTEEGKRQVTESAKKALTDHLLDSNTIIISSPLSRCRESAQIAKQILNGKGDIVFDERLKERWFGDWEKQHNDAYKHVWKDDALDENHTNKNVESALDVQKRTMSLIHDLEKRYTDKNILLVSHGDALQILQTGISKIPASKHREINHLETAEIRKLNP